MTCIYNEGAAGTSLLDGHNVSIRVCGCWGGVLNTEREGKWRERESGRPSIQTFLTFQTLSHTYALSCLVAFLNLWRKKTHLVTMTISSKDFVQFVGKDTISSGFSKSKSKVYTSKLKIESFRSLNADY